VLLDRAPEGLAERIRAAIAGVTGIRSAGRVRVRRSGPETFIDLEVFLDRSISFERVNAVVVEVEHVIRRLVPNSDIVVRTQPAAATDRKFSDEVRSLASRIHGIRGVHGIETHGSDEGLHVEMHLEVDPDSSLENAHEISSKLESAIKTGIEGVADVVTHIESPNEEPTIRADVTPESHQAVRLIRETATQISGVRSCGQIAIHNTEEGLHVTLTCILEPDLSVSEAHEISTRIEEALRRKIGGISKVLVHVEPYTDKSAGSH
jgi:divalent metal cation (Fe/Co/Zn/Cd) transporter